jgi:hypothetical protein
MGISWIMMRFPVFVSTDSGYASFWDVYMPIGGVLMSSLFIVTFF